jgi:glycosyltransferase involved in cell wall biosynthesis
MSRVPVTGSLVHGYHIARRQPTVPAWKQQLVIAAEAATARVAPLLHAVSESVADSAARRLHYPRRRIRVVPRGRNAQALGRRTDARRDRARRDLGIRTDEQLILMVGRHEHEKGFDDVLAAIPELRRLGRRPAVRVAGRSGRATETFAAAACSAGLDPATVFVGPRDDVPELLCAADVFVLASHSEGMPGALLEAMALETPIVVRDIPAVRDILSDEPMFVRSSSEWTAAIDTALSEDPCVAARRHTFLQRFTVEAATTGMVAFWEELSR